MRTAGDLEGGRAVNLLRGIGMAFVLYSRVPMPHMNWESDSRKLVLYTFPLVGTAVGAAWCLWLWLCALGQMGPIFTAAGCTLLPIFVTGGIHMDGFCDVCDALASHQSRERKLEIMKDSNTGAFGVLGCVCLCLGSFALWCQWVQDGGELSWVLVLLPVYVRALVGYLGMKLPNARGSGMLSQVTDPENRPWVLLLLAVACAGGMLLCSWRESLLPVLFAAAALLWCMGKARREFGGVTGDVAGWSYQLCELAAVAGLVLGRHLEGF